MFRLLRDIQRIIKDPLRCHWWLKGLYSFRSWNIVSVFPVNTDLDEFIWESLNMGYDLEPDYYVRGHGFEPSKYTVVLNGRRIWIANFPFGSGAYYGNDKDLGLPSDKIIPFYETRIRLQTLVKRGLADGTLKALDHTRFKDALLAGFK